MLVGVLDDVGEHPLEQRGVGARLREVVGHLEHRGRLCGGPLGHRQHVDGLRTSHDGPGLQPAHVEQVDHERVEPVGAVLDGLEQVGTVLVGPVDARVAQAAHRRLDRRQRRAQVVGHGGEEGGARARGLGQHPPLGLERHGRATLHQHRRVGDDGGQQRLLHGVARRPPQHEHVLVAHRHRPLRTGRHAVLPQHAAVGRAQLGAVDAEQLDGGAQEAAQVVPRVHELVREHAQAVGLRPGPAGETGEPGRPVDDERDRHADHDEEDDRHRVLARGDAQRLHGRGEEVVQHAAADERRHDGRSQTTHEGGADDQDHEQHGLGGQPVEVTRGEQQACQHERAEQRHGEACPRPASAERRLLAHPGLAPTGLVVRDDVHVDVAGLGHDRLADARAQQRRQPPAPAGPDEHLGRVAGPREVEDGACGVVADHRVEAAAQLLRRRAQLLEPVRAGLAQAVAAGHVERRPGRPAVARRSRPARRDPRRSAHQRLRLRTTRDAHDDPLARRPRGLDLVARPVALEALVDPLGEPEQGQLAQRGEVALAEELRQRRVDALGRVDVPVGQAAAQR